MEKAQGESLDAAVARAEFKEVGAVLQAMQKQEKVIDDIIHRMQAGRRLTKGFSSDSGLRERRSYIPESNEAFLKALSSFPSVNRISSQVVSLL